MKVEYTLTPEDYAAAVREHVQNASGALRWARYGHLAGLFLILASLVLRLVTKGVPLPVVAGLTLLFAVAFFSVVRFVEPWIVKRWMVSDYQSADILVGTRSLEVRPEGLAVTTGITASLTLWEGVDRMVVRDNHAFFYLSEVGEQILPRRVFAHEHEFDDFVESARNYQEAAKRRSKANQI